MLKATSKLNAVPLMGFTCLASIVLLAFSAAAQEPEMPWNVRLVYADPENRIQDFAPDHDYVALTSGGAVMETQIGGAPAVLKVGFGQSFASTAYSMVDGVSAQEDLIAQADAALAAGAAFMEEPTVLSIGDISDPDDPDNPNRNIFMNPEYYDGALLAQAEETYFQALAIDPYETEAALGILQVRQARVHRLHLLADHARRDKMVARLASAKAGKGIIEDEKALLEQISGYEREAIAILLELFRDPTEGGPGEMLRDEPGPQKAAPVLEDYFEMLFNAGMRFAESETEYAKLRVLEDFFDGTQRNQALADLQESHAYLTELLRLVGPFAQVAVRETSDAVRLSTVLAKMADFATELRQGYNPFGFLPDFIPFSHTEQAVEAHGNLATYKTMLGRAKDAATEAQAYEELAYSQYQNLDFTLDEYREEINRIRESYQGDLERLVGQVEVGDSGEPAPDMWTFMFPDYDDDGDPNTPTPREAERARLEAEHDPKLVFVSSGEIGEQYLQIASAEDRVDDAFLEMENNLKQIEDLEAMAQQIYQNTQEIAILIEVNGRRVGALLREKGRLQQEAQRNIARLHKRSTIWGQLGFKGPRPSVKPDPKWAMAAFAVAQYIGSQYAQVSASRQAAAIASLQGQLAQDMANIDAQVAEIQAMERAEIIMRQAENDLLRTEVEVKRLVRDQARLALNINTAQRDASREMVTLTNMIAQVNRLAADYDRAIRLAENDAEVGWLDQDVRLVLTQDVLHADRMFERAQRWFYIALRALEYYGNLPPDMEGSTAGLPNSYVRNLYAYLYTSRNARDLLGESGSGGLLGLLGDAEDSFFNSFSGQQVSCPELAVLSLKYDYFSSTRVDSFDETGMPIGVDNEGAFTFIDPASGERYDGARAYQAAFRAALRNGWQSKVSGTTPIRTLRLVFSTDLFPVAGPNAANTFRARNPFAADVINGKIVGFVEGRCTGQAENMGIRVNITGNFGDVNDPPRVTVRQVGNSFVKHSRYINLDTLEVVDNLWESIAVYSAYEQRMASWTTLPNGNVVSSFEVIDSTVAGDTLPAMNGAAMGSSAPSTTFNFTDRAVANDRWELIITSIGSDPFMEALEAMLESPVPVSPLSDFVTDIQLWVGWAHRTGE